MYLHLNLDYIQIAIWLIFERGLAGLWTVLILSFHSEFTVSYLNIQANKKKAPLLIPHISCVMSHVKERAPL